MAFWNRIFKKEGSSVAEADEEKPPSSLPVPSEDPEAAALADRDEEGKPKKSFLRKFESNLRRKVDGYVDGKAVELLDDATERAQQFREETLEEVELQAMKMLDLTEARIDEKLVAIEKMLEKRLRAELRMRLRAMIWTLIFVLLMALVSFAYVWVKRSTGLDNQTNTEQAAE